MQSIDEQVSALMRDHNATQQEMAELLGVSRVTIWRKITDQTGWKASELQIMAQYYGTTFVIGGGQG